MPPNELSAYSFLQSYPETLSECALERARDTVGQVTTSRLLRSNQPLGSQLALTGQVTFPAPKALESRIGDLARIQKVPDGNLRCFVLPLQV
jgi:hypothetical protein